MRRLYGASDQGLQAYQIECLCKPYVSLAMLGSPVGVVVGYFSDAR